MPFGIPHQVTRDMKSLSGTYALVLRSNQAMSIQVGRWADINIRPGYYIYVGSAFGPGGVRARVSRHCREAKVRRWHIDYLREFAEPVKIWCSYDSVHHEHQWASSLQHADSLAPVNGFGCSDCRCNAHLFYTSRLPSLADYKKSLDGPVESCSCRQTG